MSNIGKLKLKLDRLRKQRMKLRKNKEYHQREMKKSKKEKDFIKQKNKLDFYQNRLDQIREKIEQLNNDITIEESRLKQEAYSKEFIAFKRALVEDFTTFLNLLDKEKYLEASEQLGEVESQYGQGSKQFLEADLKPFSGYFSFISLKRHLSTILDRTGQYHRLKTTRGLPVAAGYKGTTDQKVKVLRGIIESIIQLLIPTKIKKKKKVKKKQPKRKKEQKKVEDTFQLEKPKQDTALERAKARFLKYKKQQEGK